MMPCKINENNFSISLKFMYNNLMLNKKGDNMRMKKEIEQAVQIADSNIWNIVHEISRTDKDLAMKLDHAIADVRESAYRNGQRNGIELAKYIAKGKS